MFGFFEKKEDYSALMDTIRQTQDRWFSFIDKLEARMDEMCLTAQPELLDVLKTDKDPYKRAHGQMLMGLLGQISQMREKANQAKEEKIIPFIQASSSQLPSVISASGRKYHDLIYTFRMACLERHHVFEQKADHYIALLRETANQQNLEAVYQEQLEAFEKTKDSFTCKQCGGHITIPKMFFIATYVNCPYCQTQNTFMPSTGAQMVLHQARSLAEQRTAHLLKIYEENGLRDPQLYKQYLRSMFDEWNKIVPDMAGENEKFYERLLKDHSNNHY